MITFGDIHRASAAASLRIGANPKPNNKLALGTSARNKWTLLLPACVATRSVRPRAACRPPLARWSQGLRRSPTPASVKMTSKKVDSTNDVSPGQNAVLPKDGRGVGKIQRKPQQQGKRLAPISQVWPESSTLPTSNLKLKPTQTRPQASKTQNTSPKRRHSSVTISSSPPAAPPAPPGLHPPLRARCTAPPSQKRRARRNRPRAARKKLRAARRARRASWKGSINFARKTGPPDFRSRAKSD